MRAAGWAICDGAQLAIKQFPELFAAIGFSNGGDGRSTFHLPDCRGYFLRGVDPLGVVDPDTKSRTAPRSGGAAGSQAGSVQSFGTGLPRVPFQISIPNVPSGSHHAYYGTETSMLRSCSARSFGSTQGGDDETRPINAYVNFIIKLIAEAPIPTGAVVAFAGSDALGSANLMSRFRLCDGALLPKQTHAILFEAIGSAHGGTRSDFNLPDYRGRFLRGVDSGAKRDPDAAKREAMAQEGATGDATGTVQSYATAKPKSAFDFVIELGTDNKTCDYCAGYTNAEWNGGSVDISLTGFGGDHETRPVNASVDHYMLCDRDPNDADVFPIGGVMAFPGNAKPDPGQWLLCNGSRLPISPQFAELYAAIGCSNGGDSEQMFNIPNYQGLFLRGTDHGQKRDPDAKARLPASAGGNVGDQVGSVQGYATARPINGDIRASVTHLPVGHMDCCAAFSTSQVAAWGGSQTVQLTGGDAESRPINIYMFFYIKYALACQG